MIPHLVALAAAGATPAIQPTFMAQTWLSGANSGAPRSAVTLRRLELGAKGELADGFIRYVAMIDPAKAIEPLPLDGSAGATLKPGFPLLDTIKDLYAVFRTDLADVQVGTAKIPVSLEGFSSSGGLLLPERALVSKEFGDKRDIGLQVSREFGAVRASLGMFARRSISEFGDFLPTAGMPRDASLRVDIRPLKGLLLGGLVYATALSADLPGARQRGEIDARFEAGPLLLQGELIQGNDLAGGAWTRSQGAYTAIGYRIGDMLQPVIRGGYLTRQLDTPSTPTAQLEAGLNITPPLAGTRLQVGYSATWAAAPTPVHGVILAGQVRY
jgi:hypothetical protein